MAHLQIILRIFADRHPYPSAYTSDRAIMSSKHKSKEAKSSKKDPEREKGKGKGKEKEGDKDKTKKEKKQVLSLSVALYQPEYGYLHHWALYLDTHNYVYQVVGVIPSLSLTRPLSFHLPSMG
jgi:hypothetical protein